MKQDKINRTIGLVALLCAHGFLLCVARFISEPPYYFTYLRDLPIFAVVSSQAGLLGLLCGASRGRMNLRITAFLIGNSLLVLALASQSTTSDAALFISANTLCSLLAGLLIRKFSGRLDWLNKQQRNARCSPFRFTITHIMCLTLFVAILLGIGRWLAMAPTDLTDPYNYNDFEFAIFCLRITRGICMSIQVLISAWAILTLRRFLWRIPFAIVALLGIGFVIPFYFPWIVNSLRYFAILGAVQAVVLLGTLFILRMLGYRVVPPELEQEREEPARLENNENAAEEL